MFEIYERNYVKEKKHVAVLKFLSNLNEPKELFDLLKRFINPFDLVYPDLY